MSNIRVTYAGLIAFIVGIIGVFTGLVFVLMVTRRLTPDEFGTWTLIGSIVTYFLISETIISFWSTRQIARGEDIGKNAILSSGLLSLIVIPIYVVYILFIAEQSTAQFELLAFGILLLPVNFITQTLTAINLGHRPQATSYSVVFFEIFKIPLGLGLVVVFDLGVVGAILAIFFAFLAKIIIQLHFARPKVHEQFNFQVLRRWIRLTWIPGFRSIPRFLQSLDIALYSIITGSVFGLALYQAAYTVSALVNHSSSISQALYPKILAQSEFSEVGENFTLTMFFAIPLLAIAILFAEPALFALNPAYQTASIIVILLAWRMFFYVTRLIPTYVLLGTEKIDVEHHPGFKGLIKSRLFLIPTFIGIANSVYIAAIIIVFILNSGNENELETVTYWALIGLLIEIPTSIFLWIWVFKRKLTKFQFHFKSIFSYVAATIAFSIIFIFTHEYIINYEIRIFDFLPSLLAQLLICISVYLGLTYLFDNRIRSLTKSIIQALQEKT